jgi:hypothetical protein
MRNCCSTMKAFTKWISIAPFAGPTKGCPHKRSTSVCPWRAERITWHNLRWRLFQFFLIIKYTYIFLYFRLCSAQPNVWCFPRATWLVTGQLLMKASTLLPVEGNLMIIFFKLFSHPLHLDSIWRQPPLIRQTGRCLTNWPLSPFTHTNGWTRRFSTFVHWASSIHSGFFCLFCFKEVKKLMTHICQSHK